VLEFGQYQAVERQLDCGHRTGQREHNNPAGEAGYRPAEHRRRANLSKTEHSKQFTEAIQPFLQKPFHYFDRRVAAGDSGTPGGEDHLEILACQPQGKHPADLHGFVANPLALDDLVSGLPKTSSDRIAATIVVGGPTVAHGQHGAAGDLTYRGLAVAVGGFTHWPASIVSTDFNDDLNDDFNGNDNPVCYAPAP